MNNSVLAYVIFAFAASFCFCAKLPPSFKKCSRKQDDFNECLSNAIEDAIRQLKRPFKEVGLPNMEPSVIPSLTIAAGKGAVAFEQNYKNLKVSGFSNVNCPKAEANFEKKTLFLNCLAPVLKMEFDYEINGKILLLPIYGKGPGLIILDKMNHTLLFNLEEYEKKHKMHYKVHSCKITMDPERITFDLQNLFNGDKTLGENVLKVLNENWKDVFADVKASYEDAFGQVFASIFNNLLGKVPVEDLFDN